MKASLIVSVYKNVRDLEVVLEGLKFQTFRQYEIIISEDGESEPMHRFLSAYKHPNPIRHFTQPDVGWRKNQALNNAIRKTDGDYLIFIDGDCVLHQRFIEHHIRFAAPGKILAGKRVKLGPAYSEILRKDIDRLPNMQKRLQREPVQVLKDGAKFYEEAFYINPEGPFGWIPRMRRMRQLKGCNMSFHRQAIEHINGFDEDYKLPAIGEDIDLTWRFNMAGYQLFSLRNIAVQYHLHHKENWTEQSENSRIMQMKKADRAYVCRNGLKKSEPVA